MSQLAKIAQRNDCRYIRWLVLYDNAPAVRFYEFIQAQMSEGWRVMFLQGDALSRLARMGEWRNSGSSSSEA